MWMFLIWGTALFVASEAAAQVPARVCLEYSAGTRCFYEQTVSVPSAVIESPKNNQVIQKAAGPTGGATVHITHRGGPIDFVRVKQGAQIVAERQHGDFTLTPGWFRACVVQGGQESDCINFGVGDVYVVAGQSNAVSPPQGFPAKATVPGKVIVSDVYGQGVDTFLDAGADAPSSSTAWVHMGNYLDRTYPIMIVNVASGNTSTYDWTHVAGLFSRLIDKVMLYKPRAILWHQGESDCTNPPRTDSFANMDVMVSSLLSVTSTPWVVATNSTSYPPPSGYTHWPIRDAQTQLYTKWDHVYWGPDTDTIRKPGQVEFLGDDLRTHGILWGQVLQRHEL
jgi:hypothetical protein